MTTYARIVGGCAVDIVVTPPELAARFAPEWLAKQTFIPVPDGTLHGAKDMGAGSYANPPAPVPVVIVAAPDPITVLTQKVDALTVAVAALAPPKVITAT